MFSCITLAPRGAEISLRLCGDVRGSIDRAFRRSFIFKLSTRLLQRLDLLGGGRRILALVLKEASGVLRTPRHRPLCSPPQSQAG
jgi:hypothetical protein